MQIFGLSPVEITLIICIVGIALRVYIGRVKNPNTKFNFNVVILSFMVGVITSVGLVAPVIDAIPVNSTQIIILPLIAGQIIVVMKTESIAVAALGVINKVKSGEKSNDS